MDKCGMWLNRQLFTGLYTGGPQAGTEVFHRLFTNNKRITVITTTALTLWRQCLEQFAQEFSDKQCSTWLQPLQAQESEEGLTLLAPNRFVRDWVKDHFYARIREVVEDKSEGRVAEVTLGVGHSPTVVAPEASVLKISPRMPLFVSNTPVQRFESNLNPRFTFENFVQGNSNQLARAASLQVSENAGHAYNPLFIYGGVGLGKTHLMHAVGNHIQQQNPDARALYLHSERFVQDMVKALQNNKIDEFKRFYRSLNVLLIDDIQFFAGKDRSQEEFFHTFNALLEGHQQIVLTSDKYPKEISGVEERLRSRFGWGLTVIVEPPELETRVAIIMSKAEEFKVDLPYDAAFFIAKRIRSNVRELEGALRRVVANAQFTGKPITIDFVCEALKDLLALQDKQVTIENIIKVVADFYKVKLSDMLSKRRSRSVARPRQMAMALAKELTNHSLPEIGDAFGGRDHTTVIHACRKVAELVQTESMFNDDWKSLMRVLVT